jgi:putative transcriptional regulator
VPQPEPDEPLDPPELTREDFERMLRSDQRQRIIAGKLERGDVAALRRFVDLTQEQFAEALGISVHTLRNWEQDRVTPDGPGLALLRIGARDPSVIRKKPGVGGVIRRATELLRERSHWFAIHRA